MEGGEIRPGRGKGGKWEWEGSGRNGRQDHANPPLKAASLVRGAAASQRVAAAGHRLGRPAQGGPGDEHASDAGLGAG